ncbi:MAG TPA: ATP-binding protein [Mycobacteriales bacterium]|nr:ATP-binding protein [Mycobacteriales bacterium]
MHEVTGHAREGSPQWLDDHFLDAATIVVSELVTNALSHVGDDGGTATLALDLRDGLLHLSVRDGSVVVPRMRSARLDDTGGRGLSIVEQLSTRWGTETHEDGKRVFADLPVRTRRAAGPRPA